MGFPSPARDYIETDLDLNSFLIKHPSATFFLRVNGNKMWKSGIFSGDILIVDKSITPCEGHIIVAVSEGEFLVRKLMIENGIVFISTDFRKSRKRMCESDDFTIWGIVTCVLHDTINN